MCVNHCLLYVRMTQYFLQGQNIATVHHEMAGKGMPQNVNSLTVWQIRSYLLDRSAQKFVIHVRKNITRSPLTQLIKQRVANRYSSVFAVLSVNKHRFRMSKMCSP